ncbi:MAG: multidrug ABC transporter substrate-binding protein [Proteobacteria bacterium]|jgi:putative ABC transport system permease protein|nr:multidrug ABC transporter substrate-binding protein [Pseudomonadota bacterium]MDP6392195.1 ABC transporter permease [Arenicellales bacterium]MDP7220758.1 ABC transporter permease [Arenicellales bacterium]HCF72300.1 multidrug ABC transporter substrate-binding protein [Gammaproteobacteria bacterium]HJP10239.1 ABC transporter permease [Arenicellales bacterium]|tara:strand:- start:4111 stop:5343 length:1233 start_codon:yes stop_codon:yes gene_type:complete
MTFSDCLLSAAASLRSNKLRTALTTLGIIIGVAAVIAMVGVGKGAEQRIDEAIQGLGENVLFVRNGTSVSGGVRGGSNSKVSLTKADAAAIERQASAIAIAAPTVRTTGQVVSGNSNWFTTIFGVGDAYLRARDWTIGEGRTFNPQEERAAAKVAIIGETIVEQLLPGQNPIGNIIRIERIPFRVIGVTRPKGESSWGRDHDDVVFVPISTAKSRMNVGERFRGRFVRDITVKARSADLLDAAEQQIIELLRQRHRIRPGQPDDFYVRNIAQYLEARAKSERTMSMLLAAVAGISLIVGGIGIMNIMLVSVTERTREVGLRMAVGARGQDILLQFVTEAVAVSLIGGLVGVILGFGGSLAAARIAGWPVITSPFSAVVAMGFAALVGVFFGYYPALKASRLDPIEALRHE